MMMMVVTTCLVTPSRQGRITHNLYLFSRRVHHQIGRGRSGTSSRQAIFMHARTFVELIYTPFFASQSWENGMNKVMYAGEAGEALTSFGWLMMSRDCGGGDEIWVRRCCCSRCLGCSKSCTSEVFPVTGGKEIPNAERNCIEVMYPPKILQPQIDGGEDYTVETIIFMTFENYFYTERGFFNNLSDVAKMYCANGWQFLLNFSQNWYVLVTQ